MISFEKGNVKFFLFYKGFGSRVEYYFVFWGKLELLDLISFISIEIFRDVKPY